MDNTSKITKNDIYKLLSARFEEQVSLKDLPDPSTFKDMDKAVSRIIKAVSNNEKIVLIGDYDVDGVVSTSMMIMFFKELGIDLEWVIPNRFRDGYGLSVLLMPRIKHANVVITVDNGIAANEAAKQCIELGIDLIITDHHVVPSVPPEAYAIVNQKQIECNFKYQEICGAQIAWYLCSALNRELKAKIDMKSYLSMISIAIIADIMPLLHINRAMVIVGLKLLEGSTLPFMMVYKEHKNTINFSSEDIAFGLAPILNSAGRLEDASMAVDYLTAVSLSDAKEALERLVVLNESRKSIEQELTSNVIDTIEKKDKVIVASSEGWHEGVVGIVASKIKDKFKRPAIILNEENGICKGSGRSVSGCDLFLLVDEHRAMLNKFGGHSAAVGMSIDVEKLKEFRKALNRSYDEFYDETNDIDMSIMGELSFGEIDFELIEIMSKFEPFGEANSRPNFGSKNVNILAVQQMGKDKNHLRFTLEDNEAIMEAVEFNTYKIYNVGDRIDIVFRVSINHFRGERSIQLMIDEIL